MKHLLLYKNLGTLTVKPDSVICTNDFEKILFVRKLHGEELTITPNQDFVKLEKNNEYILNDILDSSFGTLNCEPISYAQGIQLCDMLIDNVVETSYGTLVGVANNIPFDATSVSIDWECNCNYLNEDNEIVRSTTLTGTTIVDNIGINDSYTNALNKTATCTVYGQTLECSFMQGLKTDVSLSLIPVEYVSLSVIGDNCNANDTSTTLHATLSYKGITPENSEQIDDTITIEMASSTFEVNTSTEESVTIPLSITLNGLTANTTITLGPLS